VGVRSSGKPAFSMFPLHARSGRPTTLAGVAEDRYTQEMLPGFGSQSRTPNSRREARMPHFRRRLCERLPRRSGNSAVQIQVGGHIRVKNAPRAAAGALAEFFVADANGGYP